MHGETGKAIRVFTIHHARLAGREKGTYSHDRESVVLVALVTASVASHVILACTLLVARGVVACFVRDTTPASRGLLPYSTLNTVMCVCKEP